MLRREIDDADLMTLAESLNLPEGEEAAVEAMEPHLRIELKAGGNLFAEVHWKASGRPIQIERRSDIAGEIAETLEDLPKSTSSGARRVREHLKQCREIISFEMGVEDSTQLAATLTEVLAFYFAEQGDGLVWFYHRDWAAPDNRGRTLWNTK